MDDDTDQIGKQNFAVTYLYVFSKNVLPLSELQGLHLENERAGLEWLFSNLFW